MNWYRVLTQHNDLTRGDMVLLDGGAREAALEQMGYLKFVSVDEGTPPDPQPDARVEAVKPKRGGRGKPTEPGQVSGEGVPDAPGEPARAGDVSAD